jgi:hypothetical protein
MLNKRSFILVFSAFSAACSESTHKYCRSSEAAVLGVSVDLDKIRNVNSHFKLGGYEKYEVTVAPTHQGYRIVVVSSEKIDESKFSSITDEVTRRLE